MPFTEQQFLYLLSNYNLTIGLSAVIVAFLIGITAVRLLFSKRKGTNRVINLILSVFWIWTGAVYHLFFFTQINPAAKIFGIGFIIQGILLLAYGVFSSNLNYQPSKSVRGVIGWFLIIYAILIYNSLSLILGHTYPMMPIFGIAPCPVTIFTFGFLLLSKNKLPKILVIIPFLWSIIGGSASIFFGIYEDIVLAISGILTIITLIATNKKEN
jgi:hypothetical protein